MQKVETLGSYWLLDDLGQRYLRMPKTEGPRAPGPDGEDWGGPDAGALEDLHWHDMQCWYVDDWQLVIVIDEETGYRVTAPL